MCRLCGKALESVAHILSGCSALAQNKYLSRQDSVLKVLFYKILHDLKLIDEIPPWYSSVKPKPVYELDDVQAYWDVPMFSEHQEMRSNRVDARIVNHNHFRHNNNNNNNNNNRFIMHRLPLNKTCTKTL